MDYFDEFEFKTPKQQRTIKAIEDIAQSLEQLSQSDDLAEITTRDLSDRSGYALGTIFHHFKKFDDIFVYVFLIRRRKAISSLADIISKHPSEQPLSVLVGNVLNAFFYELSKPNRKTLLFLTRQLLTRTKNPELINIEADRLIAHWMNASQRDMTNTIFNFTENELKLRFRAIQSTVRSPFFEDDPFAGTPAHREIAFTIFMRLFITPDLIE